MTSLNLKQFVITAFIHSKQFILSKTKDYGGLNLKKGDFVINEVIRRQTKQIKITLK